MIQVGQGSFLGIVMPISIALSAWGTLVQLVPSPKPRKKGPCVDKGFYTEMKHTEIEADGIPL